MAKQIKVIVFGDQVLKLTQGEVKAVERLVHQNGSNPESTQYDPGRVRLDTLVNLARKGILTRKNGLFFLVAGALPVVKPTMYSDEPFTMARA